MKEVFELEEGEVRKGARMSSPRINSRYPPVRPRRPVVRPRFRSPGLPYRCRCCGCLHSLDRQAPCSEQLAATRGPAYLQEEAFIPSFSWFPPVMPSRIINLTSQAEKSQRKAMRDLRKVDTLVLH